MLGLRASVLGEHHRGVPVPMTLWLVLALLVALVVPALAQAAPVTVRIQVVDAQKKGAFDPKLSALRSALPGYEGAKLVDELETKVEPGSSVSLQVLDKTAILKVTVVDVDKDGVVRLKLEIDAFKLSTTTKHVRDNATAVVAKPLEGDKAVFLAVTTRRGDAPAPASPAPAPK